MVMGTVTRGRVRGRRRRRQYTTGHKEKEVDLYRNPTQLCRFLMRKDFVGAERRLKLHPDEASTWICIQTQAGETQGEKRATNNYMLRRLPLHLACGMLLNTGSKRKAETLISKLIDVYPDGCAKPDHEGRLPLHEAVVCNASFEIVSKLLMTYPPSVQALDKFGRSPADLNRLHFFDGSFRDIQLGLDRRQRHWANKSAAHHDSGKEIVEFRETDGISLRPSMPTHAETENTEKGCAAEVNQTSDDLHSYKREEDKLRGERETEGIELESKIKHFMTMVEHSDAVRQEPERDDQRQDSKAQQDLSIRTRGSLAPLETEDFTSVKHRPRLSEEKEIVEEDTRDDRGLRDPARTGSESQQQGVGESIKRPTAAKTSIAKVYDGEVRQTDPTRLPKNRLKAEKQEQSLMPEEPRHSTVSCEAAVFGDEENLDTETLAKATAEKEASSFQFNNWKREKSALEKQLSKLEEQVKRERTAVQSLSQQHGLEKEMLSSELKEAADVNQSLNMQISGLNGKIGELMKERDLLTSEASKTEERLLNITSEKEAALRSLSNFSKQLSVEKAMLSEQLNKHEEEVQSERIVLQSLVEKLKSENELLSRELEEVEDANRALAEKVTDLDAKLSALLREKEDLESKANMPVEESQRVDSLTSENEILRNQLDAFVPSMERATSQVKDLTAALEEIKGQLDATMREKDAVLARSEEVKCEKETMEIKLTELKAAMNILHSEKKEILSELEKTRDTALVMAEITPSENTYVQKADGKLLSNESVQYAGRVIRTNVELQREEVRSIGRNAASTGEVHATRDASRVQMGALEGTIEHLRDENASALIRYNEILGEKAALESKIEKLEAEKEAASNDLKDAREGNKKLELRMAELNLQLTDLSSERDRLAMDSSESKKQMTIATAEKEDGLQRIDALESEKVELLDQLNELRKDDSKEQASLQVSVEQLKTRNGALSSDLNQATVVNESLMLQMATITKDRDTLSAELVKSKELMKSVTAEKDLAIHRNDDLTTERGAVSEQLNEVNAEVARQRTALESSIRRLEVEKEALAKELSDANDVNQSLTLKQASAEARQAEAVMERDSLISEASNLKEQLLQVLAEKEKTLKNQNDVTIEKELLSERLSRHEEETKALKSMLEKLETENGELSQELEAFSDINKTLNEQVNAFASERQHLRLEANAHKEQLLIVTAEKEAALKDIENLTRENKKVREQLKAVVPSMDTATSQVKDLTAALEEIKGQLDITIEEKDVILSQSKELAFQKEAMRVKTAELEAMIDKLNTEKGEILSKLETAKNESSQEGQVLERSAAQKSQILGTKSQFTSRCDLSSKSNREIAKARLVRSNSDPKTGSRRVTRRSGVGTAGVRPALADKNLTNCATNNREVREVPVLKKTTDAKAGTVEKGSTSRGPQTDRHVRRSRDRHNPKNHDTDTFLVDAAKLFFMGKHLN